MFLQTVEIRKVKKNVKSSIKTERPWLFIRKAGVYVELILVIMNQLVVLINFAVYISFALYDFLNIKEHLFKNWNDIYVSGVIM